MEAEQADNTPEQNSITPVDYSSCTQTLLSPDNRHIPLGEEFPCHLNELEQDRAATIFLTPGIEITLKKSSSGLLEMRKFNLAFISARSPATAASSRPRGLRTPRVGGQDGYSKKVLFSGYVKK